MTLKEEPIPADHSITFVIYRMTVPKAIKIRVPKTMTEQEAQDYIAFWQALSK